MRHKENHYTRINFLLRTSRMLIDLNPKNHAPTNAGERENR